MHTSGVSDRDIILLREICVTETDIFQKVVMSQFLYEVKADHYDILML